MHQKHTFGTICNEDVLNFPRVFFFFIIWWDMKTATAKAR